MTKRRKIDRYVCKSCGSPLEIDYEYHDGSVTGLSLEELSVYCSDQDGCGEADIFTGIAILKTEWENKNVSME